MRRIGFLGPAGTFSEEVALMHTGGREDALTAYPNLQDLILDVDMGKLYEGIVPVENALEGTVNITVDMLVHEVNVKIVKEMILKVSHCLMASPGYDIKSLKGITSHPQALAQCRNFIHKHLGGVEIVPSASTAAGAKDASCRPVPWGAIGSRRAAEVFGLDVLADNIEDSTINSTRFIIISGQYEAHPTGCDKTSIAFTVDDSPGSLFKALDIFAKENINLKKIESRPMRTILGQYLFLVDCEGHIKDDKLNHCLCSLEAGSKFFKHLGSYPMDKSGN